jgi:hypothetical protein
MGGASLTFPIELAFLMIALPIGIAYLISVVSGIVLGTRTLLGSLKERLLAHERSGFRSRAAKTLRDRL